MQHNKIIIKIFLTIFVFGAIVWLGGSIIRTAVAFDIFIPGTELELKNWYSEEARMQTVRLFGDGALYTGIGFGAAFVSAVVLAIFWRKELRSKGWLFMSFALFFLASVVEFYLLFLDIRLNLALGANEAMKFTDDCINKYFLFRYKKLAVPSALSFFAAITSVLMLIWRPLEKKQ